MVFSFLKINPCGNSSNLQTPNLRFQKIVYGLGNILCITPWYDFEKARLKHPTLNKLYAVAWGILLEAVLNTFIFRNQGMYLNLYGKVILVLSGVVSVFLTGCLIFGPTIIKEKKWEIFLRKLSLNHHNFKCKSCASLDFQFILAYVYFIMVMSYIGYKWYSAAGTEAILPYILATVSKLYCFLYSMISSYMILYIKCIYMELNIYLENLTESNYLKSLQNRSEEVYVGDILDIGKRYRDVSDLVDHYNDIFGVATLFIFLNSIIEILGCVNLILGILDDPWFSWSIAITFFLGFTLSMGESVYIILCCEKASSAGIKMKQLCHKLQENFDCQSRARKELFKLADIVRSYKPKFTAANFFDINQGTILKIISIATTYLIVIIQFYGTVRERYLKEKIAENKTI